MNNRAKMYIYDEYNLLACVLKCDYIKNSQINGWNQIYYTGILKDATIY